MNSYHIHNHQLQPSWGESKTHHEPVSLRGQDADTFIVRVATGKRKLSGKIVLTR